MKQKILIFYASKGQGHKIIAENLGWHLDQAGFEIKLADLLKVQSGPLVKCGDWLHTFLIVHTPWIWRFLYLNPIFTSLTLPFRTKVAGKNSERAKQVIDEFGPDLVIVAHGGFAAVVAYLKQTGQYQKKFAVAFSDFHLHRYWLYDEVDFYLANIDEQKQEMIRLGIPAEKIFVCGITLKPLAKSEPEAIRAKLGLMTGQRLVVLAAGSMGLGLNVSEVTRLSEALQRQARRRNLRLVLAVICGKNQKFYQQLATARLENVKVFGYYSPLSELYAVADVFITKPGGLSTAEALAYHLPMLITHMLPGQEELNLEYLLQRRLVLGQVPFRSTEMVAHHVLEEVQSHAFRIWLEKQALISHLAALDGQLAVHAIRAEIS